MEGCEAFGASKRHSGQVGESMLSLWDGISSYFFLLGPPILRSLLGKRKIHYLFEDGKEMAEEYDLKTHQLLCKPANFSYL